MSELADHDQKEAVTEVLQQIISSINILSEEIEDIKKNKMKTSELKITKIKS